MGHNESQWSVNQAVMRSWTVYERFNMMPSADTAHYETHLCPHVPVSGSPGTQLREALDCLSLLSDTGWAEPAGGLVSGELRNPEQSECLISRSLHSYILENCPN